MISITSKYITLTSLGLCAILCLYGDTALGAGAAAPAEDAAAPAAATEGVAAGVPAEGVVAAASGPSSSLESRLNKTISIEFRKTAIEDVLRIVADQADVDIVKSPKVEGDVTVTLTDVPLEEALNNILSVHGFTYVISENMIRVITSAEQVEKPELLFTETFEIVYADVTEVVKALDKFKSPKGSVSFIQGTSHIIVTDTETKVRDIKAFIEKVDVMTKQVLVEARIYDITSTDNYDLGIEWQAGRDTAWGGASTALGGANPAAADPTSGAVNPFATGTFLSTTRKSDATTGTLRFGWLNSHIDLDARLSAQKEDIDAKLLANPRILVLDNEEATINIVTEIPYQKLNQGGGTQQSFGTTEFKEVGVKLMVTPHIAARDQMIRLKLTPTFSVQTATVDVGDSASTTYPQPVVDKREAETTLLIKNGVTVVLGGLRKKNVAKQINKVPFLGDIPIAGNLFKFKAEETILSEIVVFITPWIVEEPAMTSDEQQTYSATEFKGPKPVMTKAEQQNENE